MKKGNTVVILILILLLLISLAYIFIMENNKTEVSKLVEPSQNTTIITQIPTIPPTIETPPTEMVVPTIEEGNAIPTGWLTYTSAMYGFQFSYPPTYDAMDDADNLYGWENGVVLLYGGGQSYDLAVQRWESQEAFDTYFAESVYTPEACEDEGVIYSFTNINSESALNTVVDTCVFF